MTIELQVGVKALIQDHHHRYLALLRSTPHPGEAEPKWDIPGGRINPGEPTTEALAREIREETGLVLESIDNIAAVQDITRVPGRHVVRITYFVTCQPGTISLQASEHSAFQWVTITELQQLPHDTYLDPVFARLSQ